MDERAYVVATAATILGYGLVQVARGRFDPFAPAWLFLTGYVQVYVIQALSYHEYALRVRGVEVTALANARAFWAVCWFLLVYECPIGRGVAARLPRAPAGWSIGLVGGMAPVLLAWGLLGAFLVSYDRTKPGAEVGAGTFLLLQFPILAQVAAVLLIVTGRDPRRPRPALTAVGMAIAVFYVFLWMYNGKRSHSLIGVLTTLCAYYASRGRRPSFAVLATAAALGVVSVTVALGWRNNPDYARTVSGFIAYLGDFDPSKVLVNLNLADRDEAASSVRKLPSYETEEYGGYLLMLDTVPHKSPHDFGAPYLRVFSTYIPRLVWPEKPLFGRDEWLDAWIAGSEFPRDRKFTGPAVGVLGATHLNGGAVGTAIVLAVLALMLRSGYEYYRRFASCPWAQCWWALTFYNAWFMTVNDDPMVWFYYLYGHTTLPPMALLWLANRIGAGGADSGLPT